MSMSATLKPGSKVFILINPVAGFTNPQQLKKICEEQFHAAGWQPTFYFTKKEEDINPIIAEAVAAGTDLVVAAGGDGTVAAAAAALTHTHVPLGIIPTGTWNAIARHLTLPASPQRAIALMTGRHSVRKLDMMDVGNTLHAMNLGVGFSATMINQSERAQKRKMGMLAYFKHFFQQLLGLQMQRYRLEADGVLYKGRATEILVANYGVIGLRFFEDRLDIHPDDGKVEILILKARTLLDLPVLIWQIFVSREKRTPKYRKLTASHTIVITTQPPALVQADGEPLGETPIKIKILPQIIRVIAP